MSDPLAAAIRRDRLIVLTLLTAVGISCASESPTAPSGSALTLSTSAQAVSVGGSAVLTAQLRTGAGQPQVGTSISFTTTLGTIEPAQMLTYGAGQATAVLSAGTASGTAVVTASSGNIKANPVSLSIGAAAVGRVMVAASPVSVPPDGGTITVVAVVTDADGNPLATMPVAFTTTAGNITPANAKTDTNGIVQTTLSTTASAVVTAKAGATPADTGGSTVPLVTGSVTIPLAARPAPTVAIAASRDSVAGAATTFTISAAPATGSNATIQNVQVTFGDGAAAVDLGAVSGTTSTQHLFAGPGTYTVSATATDSAGATATVSTLVVVAP